MLLRKYYKFYCCVNVNVNFNVNVYVNFTVNR